MRFAAPAPSTRGTLSALAVASVLLLVTGCSMGASSGERDAGDSGTDAPAQSGTNNSTSSEAQRAQDCVVGNWWFFEGQDLDDFMTATTLGAFSVATTGFAILSVHPDGSTVTTYDHWVKDIMLESAKSTVERHGIDQGTYTVDSTGTMTVTDDTIGSVTTWVTETGGQTIEATGDPEPSIFSRGDFTCSNEELEINVDGSTTVLFREH